MVFVIIFAFVVGVFVGVLIGWASFSVSTTGENSQYDFELGLIDDELSELTDADLYDVDWTLNDLGLDTGQDMGQLFDGELDLDKGEDIFDELDY